MKHLVVVTILTSLIFSSCSTMSKNFVRKSDASISGGAYGDKSWNESINFKRRSWYYELTLLFDVWISKVDESSPFQTWYSADEIMEQRSCPNAHLVFSYALDNKKISQTMFTQELHKQGYTKKSVPAFKANLRLHPNFLQHSLNLYDVYLICSESLSNKLPIQVKFPSFNTLEL